MSAYSNIIIDQGTTFSVVIDIIDDDGIPIDLTNFTPKCQMRKSYYTSSFYTINSEVYGDPLNGQVRIFLSPAESMAYKPGRYVYDVIVQNSDNSVVNRAINGIVTLTPSVTSLT